MGIFRFAFPRTFLPSVVWMTPVETKMNAETFTSPRIQLQNTNTTKRDISYFLF